MGLPFRPIYCSNKSRSIPLLLLLLLYGALVFDMFNIGRSPRRTRRSSDNDNKNNNNDNIRSIS
jgi:hypothetical protein